MNRQIARHWAAGLVGAFLWATQLSLLAAPGLFSSPTSVDEKAAPEKASGQAPEKAPPKSAKELRDEQLSISGRYARFERMLTQMADILAKQDPERADVIRRALGKGREDLLKDDIEAIVQLLEQGQLGDAAKKQNEVVDSLQALLVLLQSEDRRSSVERERERLNGLLKNVRNLLNEQRSARAATQNSKAPSEAAPGQQRALDGTEELLEQIQQHDRQGDNSEKAENSDGKDAGEQGEKGEQGKSGEPSDGKGDDKKKGAGEQGKAGEKSESGGDRKPGDSEQQDAEGSQKSEGSEQSGKSSKAGKSGKSSQAGQKGSQSQQSQSSPATPGREQLERAKEQMQEALEALRQQQREEALKNEDEAVEELQEAAEKLEEELRQLREEEKEMVLASLEARFQRMLLLQTEIHDSTKVLAATPKADWLDLNYSRCRELAQQQLELSRECSRTVVLLREDGSAAAILLAVEDIETDMQSVSGWLQNSDVSELTLSVQQDIIESLRQLIETTQKELQNMQNSPQQSQPSQPGGQQQQRLVELMAEIRVLRNLQLQVNRRTKQVDELLPAADASALPRLESQIRELAERQQRLLEAAKDLAKQAKQDGP
ncbi:MAG: hypothetical protein RLZZ436_3512 [Planctomycetota bacterium]|jgi:hypothetical protein